MVLWECLLLGFSLFVLLLLLSAGTSLNWLSLFSVFLILKCFHCAKIMVVRIIRKRRIITFWICLSFLLRFEEMDINLLCVFGAFFVFLLQEIKLQKISCRRKLKY